ncbi:hypothetical protein DMENIID0001_104360 [Sergentomyia squamirostris]
MLKEKLGEATCGESNRPFQWILLKQRAFLDGELCWGGKTAEEKTLAESNELNKVKVISKEFIDLSRFQQFHSSFQLKKRIIGIDY